MQSRIEKVRKFIEDQHRATLSEGKTPGVDTNTVAEALGIWPNEIAADLNTLVEQGVLKREGSRPILYSIAEAPVRKNEASSAFLKIIGQNGSLRLQTQLAKAAASYPPYGMHTLIIGETGVGKTLMAEEMWRYISLSRGSEVPFVVFNCAEYADNPQLLLSQLFGYEKGSFTGAGSDKAGLIEKANGGILFLDEIHRLPSTGQEMFFTVIDKGIYRRLGSTVDRTVHLMIIGATTENPDSCFLNTFKRRVPMLIQIPTLGERPIKERLDLIVLFLFQEAKRLNLPIKISPSALKLMVSYKSKANIGDLKNEIQLCCARSYLTYLNNLNSTENVEASINIDVYSLSRKMNLTYERLESIDNFFSSISLHGDLVIQPSNSQGSPDANRDLYSFDFYNFVEERIAQYNKLEKNTQEIEHLVALDLKKYYNKFISNSTIEEENNATDNLYGSISTDIWAITSEIIRRATLELSRAYPKSILISLAFYLQQTKSFARAGRVMFNTPIDVVGNNYRKEKAFITEMLPMISEALDVHLAEGEIALLALLLGQHLQKDEKKHIGLVIAAHGNSMASSVADFTNQVLGTSLVQAVDSPIDYSPENIFNDLSAAVTCCNEGKGVIILADMGNFFTFEKDLFDKTGIPCRVIPSVSTVLALETCKAILTTDVDIDIIVSNTMYGYKQYLNTILDNIPKRPLQEETILIPQEKENIDSERRNVILTYCITGMGSARIARELLLKNAAITMLVDVIPLGIMDDITLVSKKLGKRLKMIIGFLNPGIEGVPFIGIESLVSQEGINRIIFLLKEWNTGDKNIYLKLDELPLERRLEQIGQNMHYFAPSMESKAVARQANYIVKMVTAMYEKSLPPDLIVRIYIHSAAMFERILTTEPIPTSINERETIEKHLDFFNQLKKILNEACKVIGLTVVDSEVYFFMLTLPNPEKMEEIW